MKTVAKTNFPTKFIIIAPLDLNKALIKIKDQKIKHVDIEVDDSLDLSCKESKDFLVGLLGNKETISIRVNNLQLTKNMGEVALALKEHKSLVSLDLTGCDLGAEEIQLLTESLDLHNSLGTLVLDSNKIGKNGTPAIATLLNTVPNLSYLNLSSVSITAEEVKKLVDLIKYPVNLSHLKLSNNFIGDGGVESLTTLIGLMPNLTSLNLKNCGFGSEGIKSLSVALGSNQVNFFKASVICKELSGPFFLIPKEVINYILHGLPIAVHSKLTQNFMELAAVVESSDDNNTSLVGNIEEDTL